MTWDASCDEHATWDQAEDGQATERVAASLT